MSKHTDAYIQQHFKWPEGSLLDRIDRLQAAYFPLKALEGTSEELDVALNAVHIELAALILSDEMDEAVDKAPGHFGSSLAAQVIGELVSSVFECPKWDPPFPESKQWLGEAIILASQTQKEV